MTDEAVRRALRSAIFNAFNVARQKGSEQLALDYAEGLVLPIIEQRVEQAVEDGYANAVAFLKRPAGVA